MADTMMSHIRDRKNPLYQTDVQNSTAVISTLSIPQLILVIFHCSLSLDIKPPLLFVVVEIDPQDDC